MKFHLSGNYGINVWRNVFGYDREYDIDTIEFAMCRFTKQAPEMAHALKQMINKSFEVTMERNIRRFPDPDVRYIACVILYYRENNDEIPSFIDIIKKTYVCSDELSFNLKLLTRLIHTMCGHGIDYKYAPFLRNCPGINDSFNDDVDQRIIDTLGTRDELIYRDIQPLMKFGLSYPKIAELVRDDNRMAVFIYSNTYDVMVRLAVYFAKNTDEFDEFYSKHADMEKISGNNARQTMKTIISRVHAYVRSYNDGQEKITSDCQEKITSEQPSEDELKIKILRSQIELQQNIIKLQKMQNDRMVCPITQITGFLFRLIIETFACFGDLFVALIETISANFTLFIMIMISIMMYIFMTIQIDILKDHIDANTELVVLISRQGFDKFI